MARMIQITCKTCDTPFVMTPRKGRYPSQCEACKPATSPKVTDKAPTFIDADGNTQQILKCECCGQNWFRAPKRGKAPKVCFNCTAGKVAAKRQIKEEKKANKTLPTVSSTGTPLIFKDGVKYQVLQCENGDHMWERKSAKGKAPRNCPEVHDKTTKNATRSAESLAAVDDQMKALTDTLKSLANTSAETRLANIEARRAAYAATHTNSKLYAPIKVEIPADKPKRTRKPRVKKTAV